MNEFAKKLVSAVIGTPPPPSSTEPMVALSATVLKISCATLGSKADLDLLRKCQADYAAGAEIVRRFNYLSAHKAWIAHRLELEKSVADGTIEDKDGWSEAEIEAEHLARMEAGKGACREAFRLAIPTARKIAEQFSAVADKLASTRQEEEIAQYARFNLKYPGPSALVIALKNLSAWARGRASAQPATGGSGSAPAWMLPYLPL
jgi:hypothetical protein